MPQPGCDGFGTLRRFCGTQRFWPCRLRPNTKRTNSLSIVLSLNLSDVSVRIFVPPWANNRTVKRNQIIAQRENVKDQLDGTYRASSAPVGAPLSVEVHYLSCGWATAAKRSGQGRWQPESWRLAECGGRSDVLCRSKVWQQMLLGAAAKPSVAFQRHIRSKLECYRLW